MLGFESHSDRLARSQLPGDCDGILVCALVANSFVRSRSLFRKLLCLGVVAASFWRQAEVGR